MTEYIEREALLNLLCGDKCGCFEEQCGGEKRCYEGNLIEKAPASDVAPVRHGRWEQCFEDWRKQIEGDKCSYCGFEHYGSGISHYHYCPNCGARMDLEGDNETD